MLVLGLDPSQSTGFAYFDTAASLSAMRVGVIRAKGESYEDKAAMLGLELMRLIKADKPDFVAIEMPLRTQPGAPKRKVKFMGEEREEEASGSGLNAVISSNQMVGAIAAIVGAYRLPFETIAPVTWRTHFLGFGRRSGWQRKDWKQACRQRCQQLKIAVTNDDMADAAGIAFAGSHCQTIKHLMARAA